MRPLFFVPLSIALLAGCGGSEVQPSTPKTNIPPPPAAEPQPKEAIARSVIKSAIKAGLGRFLAYVEIEASLDPKGHFVGWRVVELHGPPGTWDGVDLRVGDVVTRVNGFKIERDYEADKAFKSLAVASEIRVSMLRDGAPIELRFSIVEDASPTAEKNAASD